MLGCFDFSGHAVETQLWCLLTVRPPKLMIEQSYINDCLVQFKKLKKQAEAAIAQITDEQLFSALDPESNSIAVIMKHLAGNMHSRWTDFLTSDGEKPNRNRDAEFEQSSEDTRQKILASWENGWACALDAISSLKPKDLNRTVTIRGEPHSVLQAINRQLRHYAVHVGQIVLLAKHYAGPNWHTLSIPKGKSKGFEVSKTGKPHSP